MDDTEYDKDNSDGDGSIEGSKCDKRIDKTLMEKKRRARINASITELKSLLLETIKKEGVRHHHKMEKADILEMAIKQIRKLNHQRNAARRNSDDDNLCKYISGYNECAMHIVKFLNKTGNVNSELKGRLLNHLTSTLSDSVLGQLKMSNTKGPEAMKDQLILINNKLNEQRKLNNMKETMSPSEYSITSPTSTVNRSPVANELTDFSTKIATDTLKSNNYTFANSPRNNITNSNQNLNDFLSSLVPKDNFLMQDNSKNVAIILPLEYLQNMNSLNSVGKSNADIQMSNMSENCTILRNLDPCYTNPSASQSIPNANVANNFNHELTECDSSTDMSPLSPSDHLLSESVHPDTYNFMWRPW